jgi:phosphate:Na+ symporter
MWTLVDAAGGVALLIFGVRFLRKGLDRLAGDRIDTWLGRLSGPTSGGGESGRGSGGVVRAALAGILVSLAVPSSTTLSLLCVGHVRQKRLSMKQAVAVLLGAGVGITLLVYLVAFNLHSHASLPVFVGVAMFLALKRERLRGVGQIVLSLGFVLMGAGLLRGSAAVASSWPDMVTLADVVSRYPWLAALAGVGLTVVLQSSTATVAAAMSLNGLMHPELALPILIGANVGIAVTTLIVGWSDPESRGLGWGLILVRAAVAGALMAFLSPLTGWLMGLGLETPRMLAYAHTGFNVVALLAGLALVGPVTRLAGLLVPAQSAGEDLLRPVYIDARWADEPQVALSQSKREIARMSSLVSKMLGSFWKAIKTTDEAMARSIEHHDDHVDRLNRSIKLFLTRDLAEGLTARQEAARVGQLRFLSALETVGDIVEGDLADIAIKKITRGLNFSPEGWAELERFFHQVSENLEIATAAFIDTDAALARKLLRHEESIRDQEQRLALRHFERLQTGQRLTIDTTDLHLELLTHLKHINHLLTGVAYAVLELAEGGEKPLAAVRVAG